MPQNLTYIVVEVATFTDMLVNNINNTFACLLFTVFSINVCC